MEKGKRTKLYGVTMVASTYPSCGWAGGRLVTEDQGVSPRRPFFEHRQVFKECRIGCICAAYKLYRRANTIAQSVNLSSLYRESNIYGQSLSISGVDVDVDSAALLTSIA